MPHHGKIVTDRPRLSHLCHTHVAAKSPVSPQDLITADMSRMAWRSSMKFERRVV